jgi:hypothetical protein
MTWNKYLRDTQYISDEAFKKHNTVIKYDTIRAWRYRGKVPVKYFDILVSILKLTHREMRELNEHNNTCPLS